MLRAAVLALACAGIVFSSPAPSQPPAKVADWPCFRGAGRDNHSPDKGLLKSWPTGGPKLVWKGVGVGEGYSSVAVAGDKVFTMGDKGRSAYLFALSRSTGKPLWSARVGEMGGVGGYRGPRGTPAVDGDLVFAIGQFGDLICVEAKSGKERWRKSFKDDFGGRHGAWGFSESPLVDGDWVLCTPGGEDATVVALHKKTGGEVWRCPANLVAGYSSIVVSQAGGVKHYVTLTEGGTIGVRASDGKLLWHYKRLAPNTANVPTPVVLDDKVFTCAGYGKGGALLSLTESGGGVEYKEEYFQRALNNRHGGVVVVGDYVYGDSDDSGRPYCAPWKTGKVVWRRDHNIGQGDQSASLTYADGHLYVRYANGWVALVPATPKGYSEKGSFKIPNGNSNSWAHPVVIGGRLYLREKDMVWCYDVKGRRELPRADREGGRNERPPSRSALGFRLPMPDVGDPEPDGRGCRLDDVDRLDRNGGVHLPDRAVGGRLHLADDRLADAAVRQREEILSRQVVDRPGGADLADDDVVRDPARGQVDDVRDAQGRLAHGRELGLLPALGPVLGGADGTSGDCACQPADGGTGGRVTRPADDRTQQGTERAAADHALVRVAAPAGKGRGAHNSPEQHPPPHPRRAIHDLTSTRRHRAGR
ncbi:MAG: PQQ-binding-like beta-propeller repeat protein [Gemmataceae bacterium]